MPKKRRKSSSGVSIHVENVSDVGGNLQVAGGNISSTTIRSGMGAAEVKQLFEQVYARIEARPNTSTADKQDLKSDVQQIQETVSEAVKKKKDVDESILSRKFRDIARMAPDMLDVIVATLANPLAGVGVAVRKIAEKAKAETGHTGAG